MEAGVLLTAYMVASLLASVTAGVACYAKNRHAGYWIAFSFLFPPLVLILLLLPKGRGVHYYGEPRSDCLD
jgi:hypothetical protein